MATISLVNPARYRRGFGVFGFCLWVVGLLYLWFEHKLLTSRLKSVECMASVERNNSPELFTRLSSRLVREADSQRVIEDRIDPQFIYVNKSPEIVNNSLEAIAAQQAARLSGMRSLRYFGSRNKRPIQEIDEEAEGMVKDA